MNKNRLRMICENARKNVIKALELSPDDEVRGKIVDIPTVDQLIDRAEHLAITHADENLKDAVFEDALNELLQDVKEKNWLFRFNKYIG